MIIKLINLIPTSLISSRELVQDLAKKIKLLTEKKEKNEEVTLDFEKVEFISRSAAHELLKLKEKYSSMQFTHLEEEVAKMIRLVAANRAYPQNAKSLNLKKTTLSSILAR